MSYHQTIYNLLRGYGLSEAGAIGVIGNWQAESNCEPNRVQGDFSPYRTGSKQYVADVTSGKISRDQFGHDGKGFGFYQLTYFSRKLGYYDHWKKTGTFSAALQSSFRLLLSPTARFLGFRNIQYRIFLPVSRQRHRNAETEKSAGNLRIPFLPSILCEDFRFPGKSATDPGKVKTLPVRSGSVQWLLSQQEFFSSLQSFPSRKKRNREIMTLTDPFSAFTFTAGTDENNGWISIPEPLTSIPDYRYP